MLRITLLFCLLLCGFSGLQAQIQLNQPIDVLSSDSTLGAFIERVATDHQLYFGYSEDRLDVNRSLDLQVGEYTLQDLIDAIRDGLNINYTVLNEQIILKPKKVKPTEKVSEISPPVPSYTVSGVLKEKATGELLIGATVLIKGQHKGVVSNTYGFYSLTLPKGQYTFVYSFIGLGEVERTINLGGNYHLDIAFESTFADLEEVVVNSKQAHERLLNVEMSSANVDPNQQDFTPSAAGEVEIIKSLGDIPGVQGHGDGSVYFYVRGGAKDQNLILLDEAPIYNTSHLFGFFSTFSGHSIKEAKLHKADVPIQYGGMLASVLDIKTRDGSNSGFKGYGNVNPFATTFSVEGPFKKQRSSYFVLARRSHINWMTKLANSGVDASFSDFNTKLNFTLGERDKLYFNVFAGRDQYFSGTVPNQSGIQWENAAMTARWNHVVNDRLFTNTTWYSSWYQYFLYLDYPNEYWKETVINASLRTDWSYYASPNQTLRFGLAVKTHAFDPGNYYSRSETLRNQVPDVSLRRAQHMVWYVGNEHDITDKFKLNYGARINRWRNVGESTIYSFDDDFEVADTAYYADKEHFSEFVDLEPRVSGRYIIDSIHTVKASYGRSVQYLQLLSNSTSPFTALDVWLPSGPNIQPQKADQFALGYYRDLKGETFEWTTEVYYKQLQNQIDYENHASLLLNSLVEGELRFADGNSYGVEFSLAKKLGRTTGSIAYNWSRTRYTSADLNNGLPYRPYFDRPNDLTINIQRQGSKRWTYGARWQLTSGMAFSSPVGSYEIQGKTVPLYGDKNNDRLPTYHRLDVSATWALQDDEAHRWKHYLMFSIYNLYNRHNPISVNFNKTVIDGALKVPVDTYSQLELQASQIAVMGFLPTVNYTFKF